MTQNLALRYPGLFAACIMFGLNVLMASAGRFSPADNSEFVDPVTVLLSWERGENDDAVYYNVYFGADEAAVEELSPGVFCGVVQAGTEEKYQYEVGELALNTHYYWRVETVNGAGVKTASPLRSFRTEPLDIPGVVVGHSPKSSQSYLGAPSLAVLPNGDYIISSHLFGSGSTQDSTYIFRSSDKGRTWSQITVIKRMFLGTLFNRGSSLYLLGHTGNKANPVKFIIRRSDDGGLTWTDPTDMQNGSLPDFINRNAPMPYVRHKGRLWFARIDGQGTLSTSGNWCSKYRVYLISAAEDADLLQASSWSLTDKVEFDETAWKYDWFSSQYGGWLEPNAVLGPDASLMAVVRVDVDHYKNPPVEKAALISYGEDGERAAFDPDRDFVDFPGGAKKFCIRYDAVSGRYWALSNPILSQHHGYNIERVRNALAIMSSADLRSWEIHKILEYHPDIDHVGFQYPYYVFEGDDMLAAIRVSYDDGVGGADNQHNSNFIIFERIKDFRGPYAPCFLEQPLNKKAKMGEQVVFSALANNGVDNWKWYRKIDGQADVELGSEGGFLIQSDSRRSILTITSVRPEDMGSYYCVATNEAGGQISTPAILSQHGARLLHHWKLDDLSLQYGSDSLAPIIGTVGDASAFVHNGGVPTQGNWPKAGVSGMDGTAIQMKNRYSRVELGQVAPGGEAFTIAFWFKAGVKQKDIDVLMSSNQGQNGAFALYLDGSESSRIMDLVLSHERVAAWNNGGNRLVLSDVIQTGRWYHVALSRDSEDVFKAYLNGIEVFSGVNKGLFTSGARGIWLNRAPSFGETGGISTFDDVRFYDDAVEDISSIIYAGSNKEELLNHAFTDNYTLTGAGEVSHLPSIQIRGKVPAMVFTPIRDNLNYEVQQSIDLKTWRTIKTIQGNASLSEPVVVESESSLDDAPMLFLRVKVLPLGQSIE